MAGNTVIVKPPPTAPLSSVRTLRHLVRALPPGVLNVVTGADEILGPVVVGDPRIKHVCFTGSVGGGRRIMTMAAANLTNVTLELGGNDPAIILGDADMDEAEEQFGPALPVIPYDSEAEAVALAEPDLVRAVLLGVVGRHGARHEDRPGSSHRRHLLQQPQRHRGRRARAVRRVQRQRHRPRTRRPGLHELTETHVMAVPSGG